MFCERSLSRLILLKTSVQSTLDRAVLNYFKTEPRGRKVSDCKVLRGSAVNREKGQLTVFIDNAAFHGL